MSAHTRLRGNDPGYRPTPDEIREAYGQQCRAAAEPHMREIEAVADALSVFWDFGEYEVTEFDVAAAAEVSAWLQTMPAHLKARVQQHIADDRKRWRTLAPLTVLGRHFQGAEA